MKYLVHLQPSRELTDLTFSFRETFSSVIATPKDLHCTLMLLHASPYDEEKIIQALEPLSHRPFTLVSSSLDLFAQHSLVLRLDPSPDLLRLHTKVLEALIPFVAYDETPPLEESYQHDERRIAAYVTYGSPYFGSFYSPHITLARVKQELFHRADLNGSPLQGISWTPRDFRLSKKKSESYQLLRTFPLTEE